MKSAGYWKRSALAGALLMLGLFAIAGCSKPEEKPAAAPSEVPPPPPPPGQTGQASPGRVPGALDSPPNMPKDK